jgi:hypothetical protein
MAIGWDGETAAVYRDDHATSENQGSGAPLTRIAALSPGASSATRAQCTRIHAFWFAMACGRQQNRTGHSQTTLILPVAWMSLSRSPDYGALGLRRTLEAWDLTLLGVGAIVGAGIFSSVGQMAAGRWQRLHL